MGALNRAILNLEGRLRGWMAAGPPAWTCCLWSWAPRHPQGREPGPGQGGPLGPNRRARQSAAEPFLWLWLPFREESTQHRRGEEDKEPEL